MEGWDVSELSAEKTQSLKIDDFPKHSTYNRTLIKREGQHTFIEFDELENAQKEFFRDYSYFLTWGLILILVIFVAMQVTTSDMNEAPVEGVGVSIFLVLVLIGVFLFLPILNRNKIFRISVDDNNLIVSRSVFSWELSRTSIPIQEVDSIYIDPIDGSEKNYNAPAYKKEGMALNEILINFNEESVRLGMHLLDDKLVWLCLVLMYMVQHGGLPERISEA